MGKILTFADFKRDASTGKMGLELIERFGKSEHRPVRLIKRVKSEGVELWDSNSPSGTSDLTVKSAKLIEYDRETLKVFEIGLRPLNEKEQQVMNTWKQIESTEKYQKQAEIDLLTDSNRTYYEKERFFNESSCSYLFHSNGRMSYDYNTGMVRDCKVRGKLILLYKVHFID